MSLQGRREDFPILQQTVHARPLVYLDNASTTQKPRPVIDAVTRFYAEECANIHRGVHALSERATQAYGAARVIAQCFVNARAAREIIFVRGTTEAINLVAHCFVRARLQPGDEILVSVMDHHANIVAWQLVCQERGAVLRVVPITDAGELRLDEYARLLSARTKLVAITHVSNVLGTVNPVDEIVALAHAHDVPVFVDGAQAAPHLRIDVQGLDCEFYAFSGHKVYGPTGIGVLYGKAALLEAMPPYQAGGNMIHSVTFERTTFTDIPERFEAGTPHIAGAIGLGAALEYVRAIGWDAIAAHEQQMLTYATQRLAAIPRTRVIGTARQKLGVLSFVIDGVHPHDMATVLDREGIAVRAGHHCAQPLMQRLGLRATTRASLALYNTCEEIDVLAAGIARAQDLLA